MFSIGDDFWITDEQGNVAPGEDDAMLLAVAVCIDKIHDEERR